MFQRLLCILGCASALACTTVSAATVHVVVTDSAGKPAASAVVTLTGDAGAASHVPLRAIIDQRDEMFLPLVVAVRKGGDVVFTNNDATMHQVYSFSPVKQFEFEIDKGEVSKPVVFDKPGVAAIGCNIHDNMVAYVFVADAPFAAVTDDKGTANLRDVPEGTWRALLWHPQARIGEKPAVVALKVGGDTTLALKIALNAAPAMRRMHKDY
ncbi:MAG: methylamine utilization protein [Alphaproteobacteria bacterium]|nr:methylamine utilization protein [Alphaproteobacteria bacterium]MBV9692377.1 methylamine utilization protein [Alphaproteobacteria bacterium]